MKVSLKTTSFSLIEMAMVISIIAILIVSYISASVIISKSRTAGARSLTDSSVVSSTDDVGLWLEPTLDRSFVNNQAAADSGVAITNWSDNSGRNNSALQSNSANSPTFITEGINKIPALNFDGTNSVVNVDGSFLNGGDYAIFVVEKRTSDKANNYFIGDSSITGSNNNIVLGYSADGAVIHSQGSGNSYSSNIPAYAASSNAPRVFTFTSDSSGKKTFINGILSATSADTSKLSNISTLAIGKSYQGQIGEVIMVSNALSDTARQNIEKYLSQKWLITSFSDKNIDCTNGKVTSSGCEASSCPVSIAGISTTSVGTGSGTLTCDMANYTGSVTYNCANGALNPAGSCTCTGGSCSASCTFSGTTGIANGTTVGYTASGSRACDDGFSGGPITYQCLTSGAPTSIAGTCSPIQCTFNGTSGVADGTTVSYTTSGSRNCDDGYSGSVSYQCLTSGAPTSVVSSCSSTVQCVFNGVAGINDGTVVGYTTSKTIACGTGYSGPATYSCLTNGAAPTVISGCTPIQCTFSGTAGISDGTIVSYTAAGSENCNSGYSGGPITYQCLAIGAPTVVSGTCSQIQCTFSSTTGIANGTTVGYTASGSRTCDAGYTGGPITYQCLASGAPTSITGTCTPIQCTFSGVSGVNNGTSVGYTLSTAYQSCNVSGYSGSIGYTCNSSGTLNVIGGSCSCASGYTLVSGICRPNCPVSVTGVATPTSVVAGSNSSFTCNASGYTGTVSYSCSLSGSLSTTGSCSCASGSYMGSYPDGYNPKCYPGGRWVLASSSVRAATSPNFKVTSGSPIYCTSVTAGRYVIYNAIYYYPPYNPAPANISGASLSYGIYGNASNVRYWYDCYCTTPGCVPSCGSNYMSSTAYMNAYQCVYP